VHGSAEVVEDPHRPPHADPPHPPPHHRWNLPSTPSSALPLTAPPVMEGCRGRHQRSIPVDITSATPIPPLSKPGSMASTQLSPLPFPLQHQIPRYGAGDRALPTFPTGSGMAVRIHGAHRRPLPCPFNTGSLGMAPETTPFPPSPPDPAPALSRTKAVMETFPPSPPGAAH
jgi:hypothetical protein